MNTLPLALIAVAVSGLVITVGALAKREYSSNKRGAREYKESRRETQLGGRKKYIRRV
jgi:hypothetical protein